MFELHIFLATAHLSLQRHWLQLVTLALSGAWNIFPDGHCEHRREALLRISNKWLAKVGIGVTNTY